MMDKIEIIERLERLARCAIHTVGELPFVMSLDDGIAVHEAIDIIQQSRSQSYWIPCSERLPNHDEYIKNNGLFIVSDGNRSYSEWYDIYGKRRFGEPTMSGFRTDYAVIAWMPLPEPYAERRNDE